MVLSLVAAFVGCEPGALQSIPAPTPHSPVGPAGSDAGTYVPPSPGPTPPINGELNRLPQGLRISSVSLFQPLEVPLFPSAQASAETVPLIFYKTLAVRVGVEVPVGFVPQPLRVELTASTAAAPLSSTQVVHASSAANAPDSYFTIEIPAAQVVQGLAISLRLLGSTGQPVAPGVAHPAAWPPVGAHSIPLVQGVPLDLVLVPVNNTNDPVLGNFDLSLQRLESYRQTFLNMLPLDPHRFNLSAHAPLVTTQPIDNSNYGYHSRMIDELASLHEREGLPQTTAMYGLLSFDYDRFPCEGCPAGLANGVTVFHPYREPHDASYGPPTAPVAVGVHLSNAELSRGANEMMVVRGYDAQELELLEIEAARQRGVVDPHMLGLYRQYTGAIIDDVSHHSTTVHEVLHTLGYGHVRSDIDIEPPMTYGTYRFPYMNGGIGRMVRDPRLGMYVYPEFVRDIMSYGTDPLWVSDHHYRVLFDAVDHARGGMQALSARPNISYFRALVQLDHGVMRRGTITARTRACKAAPHAPNSVVLFPRSATGRRLEPVIGHLTPFSQPSTGHLLIPQVDAAVAYEIRRWGTTVRIEAPRSGARSPPSR